MAVDGKLTIKDKVSAKLEKIMKITRRTSEAHTKLQSAVNHTSADLAEYARIGESAYRRTARSAEEARVSTERLGGATSKLGGLFRSVIAGLSFAALKNKIDEAMGLFNKQYEVEMQLAVVMKNRGADKASFDSIRKEAARLQGLTTFGDEALIAGAAELGTYLSEPEAIKRMMSTLTDYAAGMGGMDVDPRQMVEYATGLGKALEGQYEGLTKKGFILSDAQKEIIKNGTEMERVAVIGDVIAASWSGMATSFAETPQGKMQQFNNTIGDMWEIIGEMFIPATIKAKEALAGFMQRFTSGGGAKNLSVFISKVIGGLVFVLEMLGNGFAWVGENWDTLEPFLVAGLILFGAWKAAVIAQTIAQWALNAAMLANPMWAVIAVIAVIIAAIATWVNSVGGARVAWLILVKNVGYGWDMIRYYFAVGVGFVQNILGEMGYGAHNIWVGIQNGAELMAVGVLDSLQWMLNNGIGMINGFISAVNLIPGVNIGLIDNLTFATTARVKQEAAQKARDAEIRAHRSELDAEKLKRSKNAEAILQSAEKTMKARQAEIDSIRTENTKAGGTVDAWGASRTNNHINSIDAVGEVGKIGSDVNIAEEDLKLLAEYGTLKYVQNFITYSPTVAFHDTVVNEKADFNEFVDKLNGALEEEAYAFAEEVHR